MTGAPLIAEIGLLFCGGGAGLFVLAAEALDAACGVEHLLLAGKERVARGADFNVDVAAVRGAGGKGISAGAVHADLMIVGVDGCLHFAQTFLRDGDFERNSPHVSQRTLDHLRQPCDDEVPGPALL